MIGFKTIDRKIVFAVDAFSSPRSLMLLGKADMTSIPLSFLPLPEKRGLEIIIVVTVVVVVVAITVFSF